LYKKGISKSIIADAISKFGKVAEKESAERTADKKLRTLAKYDAKIAKNKLTVYLLGKGYSPDVVYSLVDTKFKKK
jgi:SOS response regulatory protein OraA/RecX